MGDRTGYDILVGLHVASAIVGFASVGLSGVYGASLARPGRPGTLEEAGRYFRSRGTAEWLLLAVPFLGLAALSIRPEGSDFAAAWVIGGALAWLAAAALFLGVVRPAERRIRSAIAGSAGVDGATDTAAAQHAGARLKWASAATDVLFVVALALMVTQPG